MRRIGFAWPVANSRSVSASFPRYSHGVRAASVTPSSWGAPGCHGRHRDVRWSTESAADGGRPRPKLPFRFETGIALFAKRAPRPFPPPFLSPPSGSFSDPLSTHDRSRHRLPSVNGELIRGHTNGDDAVYANDWFICANDGVGAWSTRPGGHAGYDGNTRYQTV